MLERGTGGWSPRPAAQTSPLLHCSLIFSRPGLNDEMEGEEGRAVAWVSTPEERGAVGSPCAALLPTQPQQQGECSRRCWCWLLVSPALLVLGVCVRDSVLSVVSPLGVTTVSARSVSPSCSVCWLGLGGGRGLLLGFPQPGKSILYPLSILSLQGFSRWAPSCAGTNPLRGHFSSPKGSFSLCPWGGSDGAMQGVVPPKRGQPSGHHSGSPRAPAPPSHGT